MDLYGFEVSLVAEQLLGQSGLHREALAWGWEGGRLESRAVVSKAEARILLLRKVRNQGLDEEPELGRCRCVGFTSS